MTAAARLTPRLVAHAVAAASKILQFAGPADDVLSRYFRSQRELGQH
ncbi:MAG TPA: hypothetical protein VEL04_07215 [Burkholderiales bacterium]|nr:hypothetical protein [Burkholderiales bacterium]